MSCTYLAHHEQESIMVIIIITAGGHSCGMSCVTHAVSSRYTVKCVTENSTVAVDGE